MTTDGRDDAVGAPKRKLIEVALPLETINRESAREKSIRHGHPSTLHLWWARRPLAAARAVLFAQLVDDPSSHPDRFPTEEAQRAERERLHGIIERLVVWENTRDQALLAEAHAEILESTGGNPPPILDPFAGGGTIPLEAQRLGLEAHASDLNPVAVLINKALIEIPPKFAGRPPVFPGLADSRIGGWEGATGLAADVRAYGEWMRDEAREAHRRALPAGDARRRHEGDRHRLDLGADGDLPEPGVRDRDAARALVVARQEEGQGGVGSADHRRRLGAPERQAGGVRDRAWGSGCAAIDERRDGRAQRRDLRGLRMRRSPGRTCEATGSRRTGSERADGRRCRGRPTARVPATDDEHTARAARRAARRLRRTRELGYDPRNLSTSRRTA